MNKSVFEALIERRGVVADHVNASSRA